MKKKVLFAAMALVVLASCSDETFVGDVTSPQDNSPSETNAIVFASASQGVTRADFTGKDAAEKLGSKFVVTGFKGSSTASVGSIVFDNYVVQYTTNTANTTESNSMNWEYVGITPIPHATTNGISSQTIKYWDYSQQQYDFLAWSTGKKGVIYDGTPNTGQVLVTNIQPNSKNSSWTAEGTGTDPDPARIAYTFTGTAADLSECYISDIVTVNKSGNAGVGEVTGYNQPVTLKFRQLGTKVRIGIYETVPGYSVRDVKFYVKGGELTGDGNNPLTFSSEIVENATLFTVTDNNIFTNGTYSVYFPTVDDPDNADNNQAHIKFSGAGAQKTTVDWGTLDYTIAEQGEKTTGERFLGRTSNTASMAGDPAKNYYEVFLPNESGTNLNLRVDFTMESIDGSGEIINVKNAQAQVPSIYTEWKPGYAYTYLFKINDKTNGRTGVYDPTNPDGSTYYSDPAGLYPITFDAVVVNAEDGDNTQETITTVSTPSITSYQKGSTVVDANEYTANGNDIFVTVNDATTDAYMAVPNGTILTKGNTYFTSAQGAGAFIALGTETANGTNYYVQNLSLNTGALQTLTGKVALYTIPEGKTEAEVIDALSYYYTKANEVPSYNPATPTEAEFSKNTYYTRTGDSPNYEYNEATTFSGSESYFTKTITSGTTTGRSGIELTGASFALVKQVEFGADGNAIPVGKDQALRFTPIAPTSPATVNTYAFVYTKNGGSTDIKYQAKSIPEDDPATSEVKENSVKGYYRYALVSAPAGDVQKGTIYFDNNNASKDMITPFLGQTVNNFYLDNQGNAIASGYAVTGTHYYYTTNNGQSYTEAHNVTYDNAKASDKQPVSSFYELVNNEYVQTKDKTLGWVAYHLASGTQLQGYWAYNESTNTYTEITEGTTATDEGYWFKREDGKAYYYKQGENDYRLCIFLPQQTTGLYVISETAAKVACGDTDTAVKGMTYFDWYTFDNSVRYAKVIKVE